MGRYVRLKTMIFKWSHWEEDKKSFLHQKAGWCNEPNKPLRLKLTGLWLGLHSLKSSRGVYMWHYNSHQTGEVQETQEVRRQWTNLPKRTVSNSLPITSELVQIKTHKLFTDLHLQPPGLETDIPLGYCWVALKQREHCILSAKRQQHYERNGINFYYIWQSAFWIPLFTCQTLFL